MDFERYVENEESCCQRCFFCSFCLSINVSTNKSSKTIHHKAQNQASNPNQFNASCIPQLGPCTLGYIACNTSSSCKPTPHAIKHPKFVLHPTSPFISRHAMRDVSLLTPRKPHNSRRMPPTRTPHSGIRCPDRKPERILRRVFIESPVGLPMSFFKCVPEAL